MSTLGRRRWERVRKELEVVISLANGITMPGRAQDICEGGMGFVCRGSLNVGDDHRFLIAEIADTPLPGTVRWCTPTQARGTNLIGIEFTGLNAGQTDALESCIARWKAKDAGHEDG